MELLHDVVTLHPVAVDLGELPFQAKPFPIGPQQQNGKQDTWNQEQKVDDKSLLSSRRYDFKNVYYNQASSGIYQDNEQA